MCIMGSKHKRLLFDFCLVFFGSIAGLMSAALYIGMLAGEEHATLLTIFSVLSLDCLFLMIAEMSLKIEELMGG